MNKDKLLKKIAFICLWDAEEFTDGDILFHLGELLNENADLVNKHETLKQIKQEIIDWELTTEEDELIEDSQCLEDIFEILKTEGYLTGGHVSKTFIFEPLKLGFSLRYFPRNLKLETITNIILKNDDSIGQKFYEIYFLFKDIPYYEFCYKCYYNLKTIDGKPPVPYFDRSRTDLSYLRKERLFKLEREILLERIRLESEEELKVFKEEEEGFLSILPYLMDDKKTNNEILEDMYSELSSNPEYHKYRLVLLMTN